MTESIDIPKAMIMPHVTAVVTAIINTRPINEDNVASLIKTTYDAFQNMDKEDGEPRGDPAVPIDKSITDDHIICLEDGAKLKMLKRYLRTQYDMTPDEYRARWGLPKDYPMVAPEYAKRRSEFAKKIGLGKN